MRKGALLHPLAFPGSSNALGSFETAGLDRGGRQRSPLPRGATRGNAGSRGTLRKTFRRSTSGGNGFVRRHHVGHRRSPAFGEIPDGTSRSRTAEKPGTWITNRNPQRPGLIGNEDLNLFSGSTRTPMNASETLLREILREMQKLTEILE